MKTPPNAELKVHLNLRVDPRLARLIEEKAEQYGESKTRVVEDLLWFAIASKDRKHPDIPQMQRDIMDGFLQQIRDTFGPERPKDEDKDDDPPSD